MILGALISGAAALWVRTSYSKYSKKMSNSGLTGAQTARMILDRNNLTNVRVEPVAGQLTDHYDPMSKVIRLSEGNFRSNSIAAASVAAHECGHAIQDASGYLPVEINASTRAYGILTRYGILSRGEADGTKRVLTAAAFTYIAAALTSLLTLLYLLALSRE